MLKTRIVLILTSAALIALLFFLPKVVVENDGQLKSPADSVAQSQVADAKGHSELPAELKQSINTLRAQYLAGLPNQKNAIFADSLRSLYAQAGQFDSAAWYGEQAATFFKTTSSFLKAGNAYYEAYSFAMQPEKQKAMAEKAQEWLARAVEADPKNLEAKVKMAMTYVSSSTPMKGIQMMREVLAEDPKNEFALFNMGMLSIQSGQYARAIERLEELAQVNPRHLQGQMLLGVAYLNNGNKDKARQQFEKVKKLDTDPAVQSTADSYLKELK
ncbi:MAG: tetratricopeptide repeat protein [Cytophagales bacterium]